MSPVEALLRQEIARQGPVTVARFMEVVLHHPQHGYYRTQKPLGREADFITAPEISSLFGEVIGGVLLAKALSLSEEMPIHLIELGPGRGLLLQDILRVFQLRPQVLSRLCVHLIDINMPYHPTLTAKSAPLKPFFYESYQELREKLPRGAVLLVANEFLDALPVAQYERTKDSWTERAISINPEGNLHFTSLPCPTGFSGPQAPAGAIIERCPTAEELVQQVSQDINARTGMALFIDYGSLEPGFGDTLQAIHRHRHVDPLSHLGEADLTCHVSFAPLVAHVMENNLSAHCMTQRDFLLHFGAASRLEHLLKKAGHRAKESLIQSFNRLISPTEMGTLFKVMMVEGS
ncbi:MAG: class I SAM-dependent methyltransferase [Holosporales bacterium]